jgi:hypothetical protein
MSQKLTIELDEDTHDRIVRSAEEAKTTPEKHAAGLIRQALQHLDAEPAKRTDGDDPDNFPERRKLTREREEEAMEIAGRIQNLEAAGWFSEANDLAKIYRAKLKYGQPKQSVAESRHQLTNAIARAGNRLLGK